MANLRELRNKLNTVKSTRKLTSAMKLVAGVKLRKAEKKAVSCRQYAYHLKQMIAGIRTDVLEHLPEMLTGRVNAINVLLIVFSADKGLCGNFNYNVIKKTKSEVDALLKSGKQVSVLCLCQKSFLSFRNILPCKVNLFNNAKKNDTSAEFAEILSDFACREFLEGRIDEVKLLYTKYLSAVNRSVVVENIVPICSENSVDDDTIPVFEPDIEAVFEKILAYNVAVQINQASLESMASEQSARMTAMDSATRNADELIAKMSLKYNRLRQTMITLELVEVISGAESLKNN